jgi:hypothetical protein
VQEWDDVEPASRGIIHVPQHRLVIAAHRQLEVGLEGKGVAPHEVSRDRRAAGHFLDARLCPRLAFLGLGRRHHAGTGQHRDEGKMPPAAGIRENVHRSRRVVVAQDAGDRVQEDTLPVAAWAIDEQQSVFPRVSRQRVATPAL